MYIYIYICLCDPLPLHWFLPVEELEPFNEFLVYFVGQTLPAACNSRRHGHRLRQPGVNPNPGLTPTLTSYMS